MGVVIIPVKASEFHLVKDATSWHFGSFEDRSYGEMTADQLRNDVLIEAKQCWIAWDKKVLAVALTQVMDNPLETVEMTHCAGQGRDDWESSMVDVIREWAKERGAKRFRAVCRPGWVKHLQGMGLKETHRVMEQEL